MYSYACMPYTFLSAVVRMCATCSIYTDMPKQRSVTSSAPEALHSTATIFALAPVPCSLGKQLPGDVLCCRTAEESATKRTAEGTAKRKLLVRQQQ